jgi:hypothetical protein
MHKKLTGRTDERRLISAEEDCRIYQLGPKRNEDILTELQMSQIT